MTKYTFTVEQKDHGIETVVTRLSDGATKMFHQVCGSVEGMTSHMNSITDELAESYFPKPKKEKK